MRKKAADQTQMIKVYTTVCVRVIAIILGILLAGWLIYKLRTLILLLVIAIFFAYLIAPVVSLVEHPLYIKGRELKLPRGGAILVV